MINKPRHTCISECAGCAFELGSQLATKKSKQTATHVWSVIGGNNPCDIRRYAFSYEQALAQLSHTKKFTDRRGEEWVLYKLVRVKRTK